MAFSQRSAIGITLLAAIAVSSSARAQELSLDDGQDGVGRDPAHDNELDNNEINRADCLRDETIYFHVGVNGVVSDTLDFQVWRGTDCANERTRFDDSSNCVQIPVAESREDRSLNVDITVREIVSATDGRSSGSGGTSGTGGTDGTAGSSGAGTGGTAGTAGTETGGVSGTGTGATSGTTSTDGAPLGTDICDGDRNFPAPTEFALHFILVDGSGDQPGEGYTPALWNARYDLVGPDAPRNVTAGIGENSLILGWAIEDNRGDINHYDAYCDPPPNAVIDDPESGCSGNLPSGTDPPPENFCGESDGYSASMQTAKLQNNVNYTVAVAAVDNFKNTGVLSDTRCEAPQLVRDYYEAYRQAGGKGGGGFCAMRAGNSSGFAAFLALGALALYSRRRSARARRDAL